ncbi:GAF domain-containing protein [Caenimonas aquaedulcis]|uniref:GAF domain-containing protein n=1 Tax=Caenimonas aquaedulcis TaxID=2793270 RepID=A0A931MIS5_9BURK|nr:GAF domain-containing protein [Caenimonas aquaedulcis]MBG9389570.1 GAF domain-containing protein [Caenimonas aquaedulcis]
MALHFLDYDPDDIDVRVAELLTATSDSADPLLHPKVSEALQILRQHLNMDVAFVSQFSGGKRTFRVVESDPNVTLVVAGQSDPLEKAWCQYVVDGRLPGFIEDGREVSKAGQAPEVAFDIGTHLSTPVVLNNGEVYGTLCCFSQQVQKDVTPLDLRRLQIAAKVLADDLQRAGMGRSLELQPVEPSDASKGKPWRFS